MNIDTLTHEQKQDLAINHNTDPQDLIELSKPSSDPLDSEIKECLFLNPNLPKEAILNIYKSPILDDDFFFHAFMKQNNLPDEVIQYFMSQENRVKKIIDYKDLDPKYIVAIYNKYPDDEKLLGSLASNPNTPQDILEKLLSANDEIALRAAMNPNSGDDRFTVLWMLIDEAPMSLQVKAASDPDMDTSILEILSKLDNLNVNMALSTNPSSTAQVLHNITYSDTALRSSMLMANIIRHPNTTTHTLIALSERAKNPTETMGRSIIQNKNIPFRALLNFLEKGRNGFNVPYSFIEAVKNHPNFDNTDPEVFYSLNGNDQAYILIHKNLSDEKLKELIHLSKDSALETVAKSGVAPNNILYALAESNSPATLWFLAQRPDVELLEKLYNRGFTLVDDGLAKNSKTPLHLLEGIIDRYDGSSYNLAINLASHPNITSKLLTKLYYKSSENINILKTIIKNPHCPEELRDKLYTLAKEESIKNISDAKFVPKIDYRSKTDQTIQPKNNQDLELLHRLKGHLKNV